MSKSSRAREPSLIRDAGALAGMYLNIFRLMEKRATGQSLIVTYEPPVGRADSPSADVPVAERIPELANSR